MIRNKSFILKKTYVAPKMQAFNLRGLNILVTSNDGREVSACYCPHIPETRCQLYCEFIKRNFGKEKLKKENPGIPCPNKDCCEDYQLYCKITNER